MDAHADADVRRAANRLAQLQPTVMRYLAIGYAAGLEDTIARLKREAAAASPVDDSTGAMKAEEIADRLALEVLRCQRMDLSLGVAAMAVEVAGNELAARRERITEAQREVGQCLRESMRRYDSIGLTSGGGFLLVLPAVSRRGLAAAAERLRREIGQCTDRELLLVQALAHYDYVDVGAPDMLATLQRTMEEARAQGKTVAWAA
jgi:GGDEF domain-containing protein